MSTKQAFTLIEVVAASLIVSMVAAGGLSLYLTALRLGRSTGSRVEAYMLAQSHLEHHRDVVEPNYTFAETVTAPLLGTTATVTAEATDPNEPQLPTPFDTEIKLLTVRVTW